MVTKYTMSNEVTSILSNADSTSAITIDWSSGGTQAGFKMTYLIGAVAPADCSLGTVVDNGGLITKQTTGLLSETQYSFRVCAYNAENELTSGITKSETTIAFANPNEVTGFGSSSNSTNPTTLALTWFGGGGTSVGAIASYQLGATAPANCSTGTLVNPLSLITHIMTGLTANTQYSFRACAINGNPTPDMSPGMTTTSYTGSNEVTGISSTADTNTSIIIDWSSGGSQNGYKVAYQAGATAPANCISGTDVASVTSWQTTGLSGQTEYSFRVCSYDGDGDLSTGLVETKTTLFDPPNEISSLIAPSYYRDPVAGNSIVSLSFVGNGGTTSGYLIKVAIGTTSPPADCIGGSAVGTSSTFGIPAGQLYALRVCSHNANATPDLSPGLTFVYRGDWNRPMGLAPNSAIGGYIIPGTMLSGPNNIYSVYLTKGAGTEPYELYSTNVNIVGTNQTRLNSILGVNQKVLSFQITPDGTKVVYVADQDTLGVFELYSVPIDGSLAPTKLSGAMVAGGDIVDKSGLLMTSLFLISPDSSKVVYLADQDIDGKNEIFSVNIDGTSRTQLNTEMVAPRRVIHDYDNINKMPRFAKTGSTVLFLADMNDGADEFNLISVPIGGGTNTDLSAPLVSGGVVAYFSVSPDENKVIYGADKDTDGVGEVYVSDAITVSSTKVSSTMGANADVGVIAFVNNTTIVYTADKVTDDKYDLYSNNLTGTNEILLNDALPANGDVVGINGKAGSSYIVYQADQYVDEQLDLFVSPLAGGGASRLTKASFAAGAVVKSIKYSDSGDYTG